MIPQFSLQEMSRFLSLLAAILCAGSARSQHGLAVYPLEASLGYRSNLDKRGFWDLKAGGYVGGAFPVTVDVEMSRIWRNKSGLDQPVRVYGGLGLSLFGIVPGLVVPVGIEVKPLQNFQRLVFIADASPRFDLYGEGAFQLGFRGHVGLAYHFVKK